MVGLVLLVVAVAAVAVGYWKKDVVLPYLVTAKNWVVGLFSKKS